MITLEGCLWRHRCVSVPGTAETLQPLSSGFRAVNIDAGRRVDFDTAEKCGEQELVAVNVVKR